MMFFLSLFFTWETWALHMDHPRSAHPPDDLLRHQPPPLHPRLHPLILLDVVLDTVCNERPEIYRYGIANHLFYFAFVA